jgi:hypothetical protein
MTSPIAEIESETLYHIWKSGKELVLSRALSHRNTDHAGRASLLLGKVSSNSGCLVDEGLERIACHQDLMSISIFCTHCPITCHLRPPPCFGNLEASRNGTGHKPRSPPAKGSVPFESRAMMSTRHNVTLDVQCRTQLHIGMQPSPVAPLAEIYPPRSIIEKSQLASTRQKYLAAKSSALTFDRRNSEWRSRRLLRKKLEQVRP